MKLAIEGNRGNQMMQVGDIKHRGQQSENVDPVFGRHCIFGFEASEKDG
jgi:hypothetical protein